jgi:hypothetical protein
MIWAAKAPNTGFMAAAVTVALCLVVAAMAKTDKRAPAMPSPRETETPSRWSPSRVPGALLIGTIGAVVGGLIVAVLLAMMH